MYNILDHICDIHDNCDPAWCYNIKAEENGKVYVAPKEHRIDKADCTTYLQLKKIFDQYASVEQMAYCISTSVDEMTMAAGARMWESEMFTEDQMVAWENKTPAQQTWQNLQDYFTEKWLECCQYSQATAKHSRFKDAALAAQETAAAEEEGEASAMMFALLQEQHKAQLDTMASANQKAMEAIFERMNAIVAGNGPGPDKENTPPGGNEESISWHK